MTKFEIRGPSGLGDAIYVNPIAQAFSRMYDKVLVRTKYPEVFKYCKKVETVPFKKGGADKEFNYGGKRREDQSTSQWQDLLITSGLSMNTPYVIEWRLTNRQLEKMINDNAENKKILIMSSPHVPFARLDKFGLELIPNWKKFIPLLEYAKDNGYFIIQAGKGKCLWDYGKLIDIDLTNKTTVCDIMDLGIIGDVFLGQPGFIVPLAEGNGKNLYLIFSRRGLNCNTEFLKNITGKKVCSTRRGFWGVDDFTDEKLVESFRKCLLTMNN